ncbi:MAG: hypothetical protein U0904_05630 [Candidatus Nanopelagicales bacterium]|nr:hypothetical protein [Candidatus Nanopelagicales bacterium]
MTRTVGVIVALGLSAALIPAGATSGAHAPKPQVKLDQQLVSAASANQGAARRTRIRGWSTRTRAIESGKAIRDRVRVRSGSRLIARVVILKKKLPGTSWRNSVSRRLKTNDRGRLTVRMRPTDPGPQQFRLRVPLTNDYRRAATRARTINVVVPETPDSPTVPDPPAPANICAADVGHSVVGQVGDSGLDEISGLVASRTGTDAWWVHNDSGDGPALYAMSADGQLLRTVSLTGAVARDWEDIAIGPGPIADTDYLYAADIGDNNLARAGIVVYRVPEPSPVGANASVVDYDVLSLTYPDGAHNAETLLVDPLTGDLLIVTKTNTGVAGLYSLPALGAGDQESVLQLRGTLQLSAVATGGDVSPNGRAIAIRTYSGIRGWARDPAEPLWDTLGTASCELLSVGEEQGEALGFASDNGSYVTISEGDRPDINRFVIDE